MADIVLRDRNGTPVQYPGVERIKVNTVDGEAVEFVDSAAIPEIIENLPIIPDFSGGNQTIIAPDGVVVKSAIIQKPATLTPENIAEGVNVAGIVGTLAAGGGGANIKMACGSFAGTGSAVTVEHGLGVVPDILFVGVDSGSSNTQNATVKMAFGISSNLQSLLGTNNASHYLTSSFVSGANHKLSIGKTYASGTIDNASTTNILTANATSFRVGTTGITTQWQTDPTKTYDWYAIGGLT